MKKAIAMLMVFVMLLMFAACDNSKEKTEKTTELYSHSETYNADSSDNVTHIEETGNSEETTAANADDAVATTLPENSPDPSMWNKEEIIDFYKKAAEKSNPKAKSTQVMNLTELIINNGDGALGFFIKILEPAIASVVKKNAFDFDGITGGFANLSAADAKSIKAYKSGEYTVVEMTMKEQTDDIHADAYAGSVGHAITVLGDISKVLAEFPQFDVDVENANIAVHYVNATVKVKINKDGVIEKGTWKYTCDPEISHLDISGIMIDKVDAKIDYIITVGGGF